MSREIELAVLVKRATFLRECIASRKGYRETVWYERPHNWKAIYDSYESVIKKDAYELYEVEQEIEKFRPEINGSKPKESNNVR